MRLQLSLWRLASNKTAKKIIIPVVAGLLAVAGITTFLVQGLTSNGAGVSIVENSSSIRYGLSEANSAQTWTTKWYRVNGTYDAMCVQPHLQTPSASGIASTLDNDTLKRILLVTVPSYSSSASVNYYNLFKSSYDWGTAAANIRGLRTKIAGTGYADTYYCDYYYNMTWGDRTCDGKGVSDSVVSATNYIFAMGHMMAGINYANDAYSLNDTDKSQLSSTLASINSWFNNNYPNATKDYVLYKATPTDGSQTVAWLEYNPRQYGYARAYKYSTLDNTAVSGATISYTAYDSSNQVYSSGSLQTGSSGYTSPVSTEVGGKVCFKETSAPTGFDLNSSTYCSETVAASHTSSSPLSVSIPNTPSVAGGVTIRKVDATSGTVTNGEATNAGAVFGVWKSSSYTSGATTGYLTTITIGADGNGSTSSCAALPEGNYVVAEISAGTGYVADTSTTRTFSINSSSDRSCVDLTSNPFKNTIMSGSAKILKQRKLSDGSTTAFSGVEFNLYYSDGSLVGTQTTASDGSATFSNLKYGTYTLKEVRSTKNNAYALIENKTFTITSNGQVNTTYYNTPLVNDFRDTPSISTAARSSAYSNRSDSGATQVNISSSAGVADLVNYSGLTADLYYRLTGTIYDSTNSKTLKTNNYTFKGSSTGSGNFDVMFYSVNTTNSIGATLDIMLDLSVCNGATDSSCTGGEWIKIYSHNSDRSDENERLTVKNVEISTTATAAASSASERGNKYLLVGPVKISDAVKITGVVEGESYKLVSSLVDGSGNEFYSTTDSFDIPFGPTASGSTAITYNKTVDFEFNSAAYAGQKITVYEKLYRASNNELLASHASLSDNSQSVTVEIPKISTVAKAPDGRKIIGVGTKAKIIDTVTYTNLVPGYNFTMRGSLHKTDGNYTDGTTYISVKGFETTESSGTVDVEFENVDTLSLYDISLDEQMKIVVFEELTWDESDGTSISIASHEEVDANQTVQIATPAINTVATNSADDSKIMGHSTNEVIRDKITYSGLIEGEEYTVLSKTFNQETGEEGYNNSIHGTDFTAGEGGSGETETLISVDTSEAAGEFIVVFDYITAKADSTSKYILKHEELNNEYQTVKVPIYVGTKAYDAADNDQFVGVGKVTIKDVVKYEGAKVGEKYRVYGYLVDKESGKEITNINSEGETYVIQNEAFFTVGEEGTEESDGEVTLEFNLTTANLIGKDIVVFETLSRITDDGNYELEAEHKDINDASQTVTVLTPEIVTVARDGKDGDKILDISEKERIVDEVTISGLVPGNTYAITKSIIDKSTGEAISFNPDERFSSTYTEITTWFTAESETEKLELTIDGIDTTDLAGKEIVVFERLYTKRANATYVCSNGTESFNGFADGCDNPDIDDENIIKIVSHEDINDDAQTVRVKIIAPNTGIFGGGVSEGIKATGVVVILGAIIIAVRTVFITKKSRSREKDL